MSTEVVVLLSQKQVTSEEVVLLCQQKQQYYFHKSRLLLRKYYCYFTRSSSTFTKVGYCLVVLLLLQQQNYFLRSIYTTSIEVLLPKKQQYCVYRSGLLPFGKGSVYKPCPKPFKASPVFPMDHKSSSLFDNVEVKGQGRICMTNGQWGHVFLFCRKQAFCFRSQYCNSPWPSGQSVSFN